MMGEIVLVISGASGSIYGVRLAEILGNEVRLVVTNSGRITMAHECNGLTPEELAERTGASSKTTRILRLNLLQDHRN